MRRALRLAVARRPLAPGRVRSPVGRHERTRRRHRSRTAGQHVGPYRRLGRKRRCPSDESVDRSFVTGIAREPAEWALTTAIVRLAASLGKTTLAEGIETGSQLAHLRSLNVDPGQGYLFSKPVTASVITELAAAAHGQAFQFD